MPLLLLFSRKAGGGVEAWGRGKEDVVWPGDGTRGWGGRRGEGRWVGRDTVER